MENQEQNNDAAKLRLIEHILKLDDKYMLAKVSAILQRERLKKLMPALEKPQDEREQDIQRIKELETELLSLRIRTRHFDFANDYERSNYRHGTRYNQDDMQKVIIDYLQKLDEPIKNEDLIHKLITETLDLSEYDLEKTNSGSIRIYSTIRSAVVHLQKIKVIARPKADGIKQGHLMLRDKYERINE